VYAGCEITYADKLNHKCGGKTREEIFRIDLQNLDFCDFTHLVDFHIYLFQIEINQESSKNSYSGNVHDIFGFALLCTSLTKVFK